ncbi:MAG: hypothetical protein US86_C0009G0031 [Candidatus Daviesbacteria bacterium GW2011_GWA2_38_24]|uniref:Uncharacterized protein n=1 Tax=Candidatus Daviesbacteria bacterium GW2011_GWA2_38_24 TaxID=1618422 RepID=A0A0G0JDC5_9BACT|nr:MAG: hypothetical protein US86_C0009G0031 [Candidatus Daviesbacteria bacterium GW2011_GWA2_38_24]OGE23488.1 MAG: hypothetical protein A2688_01595 [Candidatus Daviesbacteria bacterium RIFCSPHIGHO2_01_FULL_38_8]
MQLLSLLSLVVISGLVISSFVPVSRIHLSGRGSVAGAQKDLQDQVKLSTSSGKQGFFKNNAGAVSTFPLQVNPETNELTVTTPKGSKVVTILPDQAMKNMLASRMMSYVTSVKADGELASINQLVTLEEQDGVLGYFVEGMKEHKLLGIIPIKTKVKAFVSAENGQVVKTEQSLLGRILNRVAF